MSGAWVELIVERFAKFLNVISAIWGSSNANLILFDVVDREFLARPYTPPTKLFRKRINS